MGDYIADDIRRLLKSFVFRLFVHPLDCRGAVLGNIDPLLMAVVLHCSRQHILSLDAGGVAYA